MSSPAMNHPLLQLFIARFREFIRTPEAVFWSYVFPLVMMLSLGLAFRSDSVEPVSVCVEAGAAGDSVVQTLQANSRFSVFRGSPEQCRQMLRSGKAELVLTVEGTAAEPLFHYQLDQTRPGSVGARDAVNDALQRAAGRMDPVGTRDSAVTEAGSRYIDFLVPGLIGMGLMGGGVWGVGYAIVDMRIRQVLKRLLGTPMKKHHFVAAMMASRMVFMIPEIIVILILSRLIFNVVSHGGYVLIAVIVLLGSFQFASIGLIIASRARTLEAVAGLMNLTMVPMWIGSGIFFSAERFPALVQPVIRLLPLTPVISSLRQVMQEGAGLVTILPDLGLMAAWLVVTFAVALRIFRWD